VKRDTFSRLRSSVVDDVTTYHSIFLQKEDYQYFMEYLKLLLVLQLHHRSYLSPYYTTALLQPLWLPPRYLHVSHIWFIEKNVTVEFFIYFIFLPVPIIPSIIIKRAGRYALPYSRCGKVKKRKSSGRRGLYLARYHVSL
jgi:hypothetical protein